MLNKNNNQRGYTIIETMIAVSLFLVIVTVGMGSLLNAGLLHQKSRDTRSIMDNLSFVMEDISRSLRTGSNYRCIMANSDLDSSNQKASNINQPQSGQNCWGIAFESTNGNKTDPNDQWVYYVGNNVVDPNIRIYKSVQGPYVGSDATPYIQLTPDEVAIDPAASGFFVLGAEPFSAGNRQQAFVIIRLVGTVTYKGVVTPFSLQTSVSQRLVDI